MQGPGGTMHTNINALFGTGLNTPQFDLGRPDNTKQSNTTKAVLLYELLKTWT